MRRPTVRTIKSVTTNARTRIRSDKVLSAGHSGIDMLCSRTFQGCVWLGGNVSRRSVVRTSIMWTGGFMSRCALAVVKFSTRSSIGTLGQCTASGVA